MDPISLSFAALIVVAALADAAIRSPRLRALALLAGGLAFFGAPLVQPSEISAAQRALPLAAFAAVVALLLGGLRAIAAAPEDERGRPAPAARAAPPALA